MFIKVFPAQSKFDGFDSDRDIYFVTDLKIFKMIASEHVSEYFVSFLINEEGKLGKVLQIIMASGREINLFVKDQPEETIRDLEQNCIYTDIVTTEEV